MGPWQATAASGFWSLRNRPLGARSPAAYRRTGSRQRTGRCSRSCLHIHYAELLASDIAAILDAGEPARRAELQALLRDHGYQTERIGNLSTKLRLTNKSRWSGTKADQQARRFGAGPKPWEDWGAS